MTMEKLKEKIETMRLDELYASVSEEFVQLSTVDYKLKLVFVLIHLMEECRKVLNDLDVDFFLSELKNKISDTCVKTGCETNQLLQRLTYDVNAVEAIDEKDDRLNRLADEAKEKLDELETILGRIVRQRDQMTLPELHNAE